MKINILSAKEKDYKSWDSFVEKSVYGTLFHKIKWLQITKNHTNSELILLMAKNNDEVISIFPIFCSQKFKLNFLLSPPEGGYMPYLGPLFSDFQTKQSAFEKHHRQIVSKYQEYISSNITKRINFFRIKTLDVRDVRPFQWDNFKVTPNYTYAICLKHDSKQIKESFSQSTRRYLNNNLRNTSLEIQMGNSDDAVRINQLVSDRYTSQGIKYGIKDSFVKEICEVFSDYIDVFILRENKKFVTGLIIVKFNNSVGHWIGGTNPGIKAKDPISLLHWNVIERSKKEGFEFYDLFGANTEKLCKHKSKLNPKLKMYFSIKYSSILGNVGAKVYRKLKGIE